MMIYKYYAAFIRQIYPPRWCIQVTDNNIREDKYFRHDDVYKWQRQLPLHGPVTPVVSGIWRASESDRPRSECISLPGVETFKCNFLFCLRSIDHKIHFKKKKINYQLSINNSHLSKSTENTIKEKIWH